MEVVPQQTENFQMAEDSSEDDEICMATKKKKCFNTSLLSDDEEELSDSARPQAHMVHADIITDDSDTEEVTSKTKLRKHRITIQDESSDESDEEEDVSTANKTVEMLKEHGSEEEDVSNDSKITSTKVCDKSDDESSVESTGETDNECEDEDQQPIRIFRSQHPDKSDGMRGLENDDIYDNEIDDDLPLVGADEIAEPSNSRKSSRRRDTLLDIKSETQRLIRESPINLPYHVPDEDKLAQLLRMPFMKEFGKKEEHDKQQTPASLVKPNRNESPVKEDVCESEHEDDLSDLSSSKDKQHSDKNNSDCDKDNVDTCNKENETCQILNKNEVANTHLTQNPQQDEIENPSLTRKYKLLQKYGIKLPDLPVTPLIKKSDVNLDEDDEQTGLVSLMNRFLKQTSAKKKTPKTNDRVKINIIRKELREDGSGVELVSDTVTMTPDEHDTRKADTQQSASPGEKLLLLRKQLANKMRLKRDAERKKREELYKLDNEEFGSEIEEEEEYDEDFDVSDEESGGSDHDDEELPDTEPVVADDDACSDSNTSFHGDGHNSTLCANNGVIDDSDESGANDQEEEDNNNNDDKVPNRSIVSESCSSLPRFTSDNSVLLFDESTRSSSISNIGKHPLSTALDRTCSDDSFYNSLIPGRQPENSSISSVSFNKPQTSKTSDFDDCEFEESSQSFHFDFEASQSQLLDEDGLMKQDRSQMKAKIPIDVSISALPLGAEDDNAKDGNISELLELCSGQFQANSNRAAKNHDISLTDSQELIALCSGKFTDVKESEKVVDVSPSMLHMHDMTNTQHNHSQHSTQSINEADKSFGFNVQPNSPTNIPSLKSAFDEDADNESDNEEPMMIVRRKRHKKCGKRRQRLAEFVDNEAELSGSDFGSADEEEPDSCEDEYEEDEITEQLPDEEAMKQQVGKFHLRQMMNEEAEEIEMIKEAFAEPHPGQLNRDRKFKWKNIDSDMTQNLFKCDSSDEEMESMEVVNMETTPVFNEDSQWRRDRLEREEFLKNKQQQPHIDGFIEEDSQFLQLGAKCVRKTSDASMEPLKLYNEDSISRDGFRKVRKGSFLTRSKETLSKLANFQDLKNAKSSSKSSRMVFKAVSPSVFESKKLGRRRKMQSENLPPAKRMHISEDSNSIFDLIH